MKMNNTVKIVGVLASVCFVASLASAQMNDETPVIADEELLEMLDAAESAVENPVEVPGEETIETVVEENSLSSEETSDVLAEESNEVMDTTPVEEEAEAVIEEAAEGDVAIEEVVEVIVEEVPAEQIDDLGMTSFDEEEGSTHGELISVRLNKVGLEEAINLFAQLSGANIIVPELTEAAQISVNLKDVEWRPALQSILDSYNYELYQKVSGSNVFSVRRRPVGAPEPQVIETFVLRYATVPNAAALVRAILPEDAKISEFASRNMLVVKSSESSLSEIRSVLSSIDTVRQQVFIESKFMELSDGAQTDLGLDWKTLGLDDQGQGGIGASVGNSVQTYADGRTSALGNFSEHVFTSVLDVDQFTVVLNALEANKGVSVVSNPKIIVANEELANISIIRKEPNIKQARTESNNDNPDLITFELDPEQPFFEYGIKLDVIPSINTSSNITISIKPSLTRKFGDKVAGNNTYPIIDEKTIETVFNLTSGQTAAIGGLTEVEDSEEERKVPYLGSIPFLGRLFSWKQVSQGQSETIIFVTVGLANTEDIDTESGLPEDTELARRRIIKERTARELRDRSIAYYDTGATFSTSETLKAMDNDENKRLKKRIEILEKEARKKAKQSK
jgi:type II secretory pathway component GspD/PulD (secretin)